VEVVTKNVRQVWEEQVSLVDQVHQDIHKVGILHTITRDIVHLEQVEQQVILVDIEAPTVDRD
jgi:hypothetical protein